MTDHIWSPGNTDPIAISIANLTQRIMEAVAWCTYLTKQASFSPRMRSPELTPWLFNQGRDEMVSALGSYRSFLLRNVTESSSTKFPDLDGGQLMVYFPDDNLFDGSAETASQGFFDVQNVPPWDTWIGYFVEKQPDSNSSSGYLLAYVPQRLISLADTAIDINPEGCIQWLRDSSTKVQERLLPPLTNKNT